MQRLSDSRTLSRRLLLAVFTTGATLSATGVLAQANPSRPPAVPPTAGHTTHRPPGEQNSPNVKLMSHLALGGYTRVGDIEIEQELSRPYAYVSRTNTDQGFDIISVKDPARAQVIYQWRIANPELHVGLGGADGHYFKHQGRYYYVEAFGFSQQGPDSDLGAVVVDVTGLPDTSKIKEAARIRAPETPGGFHTLLPYKHSDGRVLLFTATFAPYAGVYDLGKLLAGDPNQGAVGRVPGSEPTSTIYGLVKLGYHDFYAAYDPATRQDKFYGAAIRGYLVYDVTRPEDPKLVTSIMGAAGVDVAHTFSVTPDARYAVTQTEYQLSPLRIFDLKPGLDGTVKTISRPIGAWAADWRNLNHNHELRWPYVFVGSLEDGLQVLNMMDPTNPYTVGFYDTYDGPHESRLGAVAAINGVWGLDVRNADGLIVASDMTTGFWAFKMDGFDGWNGHQWGMPNISSVQDWDNGPEGAPKAGRVS